MGTFGMKTTVLLASALAVTCILALSVGMAAAQQEQDRGPIYYPTKPAAKPVPATLLVTCDLACNWELDGVAKGRIEAGDLAKVTVTPGQHTAAGATTDGLDRVQQAIEAKSGEQAAVSLELAKVARERVARQKLEKKRLQDLLTWIDPITGLMWSKKDNGGDVTWQQAASYCRNLQLAGHSGWRLATIDELQGIYDSHIDVPALSWSGMPVNWHVKGGLQLSGGGWWSSSPGNAPGQAWDFDFGDGNRRSTFFQANIINRALCVRRPTE